MVTLGHRGSFVGFTYNGIHSSTLGITRVIDGSRYNDGLLPSMKDVTTDIVGIDGAVYFGTTYTKRVISVSFAFDGLTNQDLMRIKTLWIDKGIHDLIFDEWPYKVYSAKITGNAQTKSICFSKDGIDYFKGEGSLQFTCMLPFARSRYAWQEDYNLDNIPEWLCDEEFLEEASHNTESGNLYYDFDVDQDAVGALTGILTEFIWVNPQSLLIPSGNKDYNVTDNGGIIITQHQDSSYINYSDWIESSRIPSRVNYGIYDHGTIQFYNAGDLEMPTLWYFKIPETGEFSVTLTNNNGQSLSVVNLHRNTSESPTGAGCDEYFMIDMPNHMIYGYDQYWKVTGRLYNQYAQGQYFLLPKGECTVTLTQPPYNVKFNYLYL